MTTINLSGIQSLDIPLSVFDEFLEKSSHFGKAKYPEGNLVEVSVRAEENQYAKPGEPALAVMLDNCKIGYIPVLSTIMGYIQDAFNNNDLAQYQKHSERYKIVEFLRDQIETDLFINHMPVRGYLSRLQIDQDKGKLLSVSVSFNYM